jgi:transcriptional regulator with XRE-family HTH domain
LFHNLGNTLALIRHLRGKSQAQVACDAKIGKSQLSKYENGRELPRLDPLERLLKALGISIHELFFTLALVDERASSLSSPEGSTQRLLLAVPRKGGALLLPETEEAFYKLQSLVLDLYRLVYTELVFSRVPEPASGGVWAEGIGTAGKPRGRKEGANVVRPLVGDSDG